MKVESFTCVTIRVHLSIYEQCAGIAQGCPLSPFLFIIVQSVMFHDIHDRLELSPVPAYIPSRELSYADDTVLMSSSEGNLQLLVDAVCKEGAVYGLEINRDKTFQMGIQQEVTIEGLIVFRFAKNEKLFI